jgi:hypothetical protein
MLWTNFEMQTRRKLLNISHWLGKAPSLAYALVYLSLIPIFAVVYSYLPKHFYHSTIQLESSMDQETKGLTRELSHVFYDQFEAQDKTHERLGGWDGVQVRAWWVRPERFENLEIDNNEASFSITVKAWNDKTFVTIPLVVKFDVRMESGLSFPPNREEEEDKRLTIQGLPVNGEFADEQFQLELGRALFPESPKRSTSLYMLIPLHLMDELRHFSGVTKGMGSEVSGNFVRMLYLSAATITTLGYGDIVPITTVSRLLVSVESILGIVLIGLFLNALSFERGKIGV